MPSLRLLTFLTVSMMGHAVVLVPLSDYLLALFDNEEIHSETIVVSISVINQAEATVEEKNETVELAQQFEQAEKSKDVDQLRIDKRNAIVEALTEATSPNTPEQTALAANNPVSVEKPVVESKPEPTLTVEQQRANQVSRMEQSEKFEARHHRQLLAEERYLAELLNAIAKHRFYPKNARKKGHQGSVEIELTILKSGEFESVKISKASNYNSLNKATTRALNRLKSFKPFPTDIQRDSWHISIPFRYVLNPKKDNRS